MYIRDNSEVGFRTDCKELVGDLIQMSSFLHKAEDKIGSDILVGADCWGMTAQKTDYWGKMVQGPDYWGNLTRLADYWGT